MSVSLTRGRLVATTLVGLAITGLAVVTVATANAIETRVNVDVNDAWLTNLDGKYKMMFDAPAPASGIPLVHVLNYYDTYNKA